MAITVGEARRAARGWVAEKKRGIEGYLGAYASGSTVGRGDGEELAATSDLDVVVVVEGEVAPPKAGKLRYDGALLEITYQPSAEIASAERVLGAYHLAGSFRTDTVLDDPTGRLGELRAEVEPRFAAPEWVRRRCADARQRIERGIAAVNPSAPFHDALTGWLFPTAVTTHVVLVAALRNPTVRLRYPAARGALAEYGRAAFYPRLLALLGCADVPAERVRFHLDALARTCDATAPVARTPFFFSGDLTPGARPVAIDGSRALIDRGDHREAVFWILATFARCHAVLSADAPALAARLDPEFRAAAQELAGIGSPADLPVRAAEVTAFLPELWATAEAMIAFRANRRP